MLILYTIIIVHKIVAVIAVYTNTIDYYYCTVDRILTYGTLLDVLWQMYHAWITYGTVRRIA